MQLTHTHTYTHTHTSTRTQTRTHVHIHVHTQTHIYTRPLTHTRTRRRTHTYAYTHILCAIFPVSTTLYYPYSCCFHIVVGATQSKSTGHRSIREETYRLPAVPRHSIIVFDDLEVILSLLGSSAYEPPTQEPIQLSARHLVLESGSHITYYQSIRIHRLRAGASCAPSGRADATC